MQSRIRILACLVLFLSTSFVVPADCQQNASSAEGENSFEGTVASTTRNTFVLRIEDNQYILFTYEHGVRPRALAPGARVRVTAGPPDENGTRAASDVTVLSAASGGGVGGATGAGTADKGAQAAPVPEKVRQIEGDIRRESRRWRIGVRGGAAFDPELFLFGIQSQMGPIFHPRVLFRPNAEFAFGEVTDLIALNLEGIYRFSPASRVGKWTPYIGAGPALIFIHQSFQGGRNISFGNFDYETGFNVLAGVNSRRGTFIEMKSSLWSGPAPKLRIIFGYNF
jgi:hypothetical protein